MIDSASRHAWGELDAKLRAYVSRRVRSPSDVDDLVQTVFLRMQGGLAELRDDQRFGPWVYQIASNAIVDYYRQSDRHPLLPFAEEPPCGADERDSDGVEALLASHVALFVAMLPAPYRETLTLTELEGLPYKAAAELLGISLSAVKSRVQRGRQQLRELFDECCQIAQDARGGVLSCEPKPNSRLHTCRCDAAPPRGTSTNTVVLPLRSAE